MKKKKKAHARKQRASPKRSAAQEARPECRLRGAASKARPQPAQRRVPSSRPHFGEDPAPPRRELYPAIEPFRHGYLRVSDVHELYYEECGNPAGKARGVPARRPRRGIGQARPSILRSPPLPHRRVRSARLRPQPPECESHREHHLALWSPTSNGCASTSASSAGWCSADRGAARWRSPTRKRTRSASPSSCCAAFSCCATRRSAGSTSTAPRRYFPIAGKRTAT